MKACFMGLGYIGLPTAIIAAKHGIQVIGVDINPEVVDKTNNGCLHFIEPGLEDMLKEVVRDGVFHAALKPEHSDAFLLSFLLLSAETMSRIFLMSRRRPVQSFRF